MLKHEDFEELCAAAAIGQATPEELARLSAHLAECPACREAYGGFLNLTAYEYASQDHEAELSQSEANQIIASDLFRQRFFERAASEGIVFSSGIERVQNRPKAIPVSFGIRVGLPGPLYRGLAAAGIAVLFLAGGYELGQARLGSRILPNAETHLPSTPANVAPRTEVAMTDTSHLAELAARNEQLEKSVNLLREEIRSQEGQLSHADANLAAAGKTAEQLRTERDNQSTLIQQLQAKLADSEGLLASSRSELTRLQTQTEAKLQANAEEAGRTAVASASRVRELTDKLAEATDALDRERQMLGANRDIRDLIAARNLHIVDVFDTDAKGKTRPAFGRVFFTEGKSLIFYAYDLNEVKLAKATYDFHVWGKKEGPNQQPRNLGIFYSDDNTQKRWVFRLDDPKILNEIDAVFVTVEPPGEKRGRPQGHELMYAYLRAQPNHP